MNSLTNHQLYLGINRRFDRRAALLRRFGFVYCCGDGAACFARTRYGKRKVVAAATLSHACNRVWFDTLRTVLYT